MSDLSSSLPDLIIGCAIGTAISFGLYSLRLKLWRPTMMIANAAWILFGCGTVGAGFLLLLAATKSKGGDGAMNAMVALIFGALGVSAIVAVLLIIGAGQHKLLGRPFFEVTRTALFDPVVIVFMLWSYTVYVFEPGQRSVTRTRVSSIEARTQQIENLQKQIPPEYVGWTSDMLDQHERERAQLLKQGIKVPRMVPENIEANIRALGELRPLDPIPYDATGYRAVQHKRNFFFYGYGAGVIIGAFALPWLLRQKQRGQTQAGQSA